MPKPRRPPLPGPPRPRSANHLAELAGQRAHATLTGRLAAIAQAHALLRLPFDARDPVLLRRTLQGIARHHGIAGHHGIARHHGSKSPQRWA